VIEFASGAIWTIADIKEKARYIAGTENNDTIYGYSDQQNIIAAGSGDDTVYAGGTDGDELSGEAGNDSLYGSYGNDLLDGGVGTDILEGSHGNDTYIFGIGYGQDTIYDNDTTQGNLDVVNFLPGVAPSDIHVRRNGDNLELRITGTEDILIVERYFSPYARGSWYTYDVNMNKIEEFHFDDGTVWNAATIHNKARFIEGTTGDDSIYGYSDQQNIINAGDGNDTVYASSLGDELYGEAGNDSLYGSSGSDILNGGSGNDNLEGSSGDDTYIFGLGDGVDTIYDNDIAAGNTDVISFQAGIAPEDIEVVRNGDNLELRISGTADMVVVERHFSPYARGSWYTYDYNMNKIEQIVFADGTTWDIATVLNKARIVNGTENADTIYGYSDQQNIIATGAGDDTVHAGGMGDQIDTGEGNDNVYGSEGADRITGGAGNDTLEGGNGNDTYVFAPGFGVDTIYDNDSGQGNSLDVIEFSAGIASEDVVVRRLSGDDLEITILGTTDKLTIQRFFSSYYRNSSWNTGANSNAIEEFRFADGTIWDVDDIKDKARFMTGSANDDTIYGFGDQQNIINAGDGNDTVYAGSSLNDELYGEAGNDTLVGSWSSEKFDGGSGNDYMEGNAGDDTYVFGVGYGQDVIYDSDQGQGAGLDKITFLEGIDPADVTAKRLSNSDLELTFTGTSDKLTIERYFSPYYKNSSWNTGVNSNVVEEFHFADNTVWGIDDVKTMVRTINGTENDDVLYGYDDGDTITAGAGDDIVYAGYANDVVYGGAGNDMLYGEDGDDQLNGGIGNDTLDGGYGDDTYTFSGAFGNDQINDYHGNDLVQFSDLNKDAIMFEQVGNALQITSAGASDSVSIGYWYSYNDYKVETIKASDGSTISSSQVEQLIQAMASWSSNNSGMSWSQALASNSQDAQSIVAQYWTTPTA
jgi:Ca2+-binding RTX toxin-like protein